MAESELNRQKNILESLKSELNIRLKSEKNARIKKLNLKRINLTQQYFGQLRFLINHQTQVVSNASKIVKDKRQVLLKASKEERKYERLKEIRRDEYNYELELADQKETDEFAKTICLQKKSE